MVNWAKVEFNATIINKKEGNHDVMVVLNNYSKLMDVLSELGISMTVYEYLKDYFVPNESYLLTVGSEKIRFQLNKDFGLDVYQRVYESLLKNNLMKRGVKTFEWLVDHTELITTPNKNKNVLVGDDEFNDLVVKIAMIDLLDILQEYPSLSYNNDLNEIHALKTEAITTMFVSKDWLLGDQYIIVSPDGYMLPFNVKIEWDAVLAWAQDLSKSLRHRITYKVQKDGVHIFINGKGDWLWVLGSVSKQLGMKQPLLDTINNFKPTKQIRLSHPARTIFLHNLWLENNQKYATNVYELVNKVDFQFVTNKTTTVANYYKVLEGSIYDGSTNVITLADLLYGEVIVNDEDILTGLYEVAPDVYKRDETDFGDVLPITINIDQVTIATPYYKVYNNLFKKEEYPLTGGIKYNVPKLKESYLNSYILGEERYYNREEVAKSTERQGLQVKDSVDWTDIIDSYIEEARSVPIRVDRKKISTFGDRVLNIPNVSVFKQDDSDYYITQNGKVCIYSKELGEDEVLHRLALGVVDSIETSDLEDIAKVLIAVYEQKAYSNEGSRDDLVWMDYINQLIVYASEYYYEGVGKDELTTLINNPPVDLSSIEDDLFEEESVSDDNIMDIDDLEDSDFDALFTDDGDSVFNFE